MLFLQTYVNLTSKFNEIKEERGAGFAEYALLLALIAVVGIVTLGPLGDTIAEKFTEVGDGLNP